MYREYFLLQICCHLYAICILLFCIFILCFCVVSSSSYEYTLPCSFSHCSVAYSCMLQCLPTDLLIPLVPVTNHVKFGQVGIVTVNFGLQLNGHNNTTKLRFTQSDLEFSNSDLFLYVWFFHAHGIPRNDSPVYIILNPPQKKKKTKTNPISTEPPQVWCLGQLADL